MANKQLKTYSTLLVTRVLQIEAVLRLSHPSQNGCHPKDKWQPTLEKLWGKEEPFTVPGNINLHRHSGNQYRASSKEKNAEFCTVQPSHGVPGYFPEGLQVKTSQRHLHTRVHRCTTHTSWEITSLDSTDR